RSPPRSDRRCARSPPSGGARSRRARSGRRARSRRGSRSRRPCVQTTRRRPPPPDHSRHSVGGTTYPESSLTAAILGVFVSRSPRTPMSSARHWRRTLKRLTGAAAALAVVGPTTAVRSAPTVSAGPCSEMFGNFGSLLEHRTGAGMGDGSLGSSDSLGSSGSTGSSDSVGSTSRALGSEDRSGSLVQQLETGSLGNGISGSLDPLVGSVYGMPPWITGEQGTVPVLDGPTRFEQLVTGPTSPNESINRYGVAGTDLGIMWDNGDAEDPEVLMAFGDTMGDCSIPGNQWRSNVLFRSGDTDLTDGLSVDSAAIDQDGLAKSIVPRKNLPGETTVIPTAGIAVEGVQYLRYMSVAQWGQPGSWTTNYSGLASSRDNGENWTVVPGMARPITDTVPVGEGAPPVDDDWRESQMSSYLKTDDHLYEYMTSSGRQGAPIVARVPLADSPTREDLADGSPSPEPAGVLDPEGYGYRDGHAWRAEVSAGPPAVRVPPAASPTRADLADGSPSPEPAGVLDPEGYEYWDGDAWVDEVSEAHPVMPAPASEMSVMWNESLGKYTSMYSQGYNSV